MHYTLMINPDAGALIKASGGLRKVRWKLPGAGKRGSLRIIYYFDQPETIYMIFMYKKNEQEDLTPAQIKVLIRCRNPPPFGGGQSSTALPVEQ